MGRRGGVILLGVEFYYYRRIGGFCIFLFLLCIWFTRFFYLLIFVGVGGI